MRSAPALIIRIILLLSLCIILQAPVLNAAWPASLFKLRTNRAQSESQLRQLLGMDRHRGNRGCACRSKKHQGKVFDPVFQLHLPEWQWSQLGLLRGQS